MQRKRAHVLIPFDPLGYPREAVVRGLGRLGYEVEHTRNAPADLLVTWSPWVGSDRAAMADVYAMAKRPVIVMENGWLSPINQTKFYQVARDGWNGAGRFFADGPERWASWGLDFAPWANRGNHHLVIGQRGHPWDARTARPGWHQVLSFPEGSLPIIRRAKDEIASLASHLALAFDCHVWSSNAAAWAILLGVPVVQYGPHLMVGELSSVPGDLLQRPPRERTFERLAWAQWTEEELGRGEPFKRALHI